MAEPRTLFNAQGESITVYSPGEVARLQRIGWAASAEEARAAQVEQVAPPALAPDADVTVIEDAGVTIVTEAPAEQGASSKDA